MSADPLLPFQGVGTKDAYRFEALPKLVVLAGLSARKKQGYKSERMGLKLFRQRITNADTQVFRIAASGSELKVANPKEQVQQEQ